MVRTSQPQSILKSYYTFDVLFGKHYVVQYAHCGMCAPWYACDVSEVDLHHSHVISGKTTRVFSTLSRWFMEQRCQSYTNMG